MCTIRENNIRILWMNCDLVLLLLFIPASPSRYTVINEGILQIYPVLRQDAGDYQCITGDQADLEMLSNSSQVVVLERDADTSAGYGEELILAGPQDVLLFCCLFVIQIHSMLP